MNRLLDIGFRNVGSWKLKDDQLDCELTSLMNHRNILYAFVSDGEVKYIGKTTKSLKQRMYFYQNPGPTQSTNIKNNANIRELLARGREVDILALPDEGLLHFGDFHINLAAGLEDALVSTLTPEWNVAGVSKARTSRISSTVAEDTASAERSIENDKAQAPELSTGEAPDGKAHPSFTVPLQRTYRDKGFFNVPVKYDRYIGAHGESIDIYCGDDDLLVHGYINRKANQNQTARIFGGAKLRDWFTANINEGGKVRVEILSKVAMAFRRT